MSGSARFALINRLAHTKGEVILLNNGHGSTQPYPDAEAAIQQGQREVAWLSALEVAHFHTCPRVYHGDLEDVRPELSAATIRNIRRAGGYFSL